jgi:hypothetical protein
VAGVACDWKTIFAEGWLFRREQSACLGCVCVHLCSSVVEIPGFLEFFGRFARVIAAPVKALAKAPDNAAFPNPQSHGVAFAWRLKG